MSTKKVIFVVNLIQDINILRPIAYLAMRELGLDTLFLVTKAFRNRDKSGFWQQELCDIALDTKSPIIDFENEFQALQVLQDGEGVLIAASESHLDAHKPVHDLFRIAPKQYLKLTLQHGFECVGFLQSRDQDLAHGKNITFAADIICGWCAPERLTAVTPSQRHKLITTGPSVLLTANFKPTIISETISVRDDKLGIVCENMHSPRLNVAGDFKSKFLHIFEKYCAIFNKDSLKVYLRPHPGGQYFIKNNLPLPVNVILENAPIYKTDLSRFAYCISAPSSILIDMVLAGIPTAVWQDEGRVMDLGNYEGLTPISTLEDWIGFTKDALARPEYYREKQQVFLRKQKLLTDRSCVDRIFSNLLQAGTTGQKPTILRTRPRERILFFAPGNIPTLQLSFLKPLAQDIISGAMVVDIISEVHLNAEFKGESAAGHDACTWIKSRIDDFLPTVVIFCRWAGPHTAWLLSYLTDQEIPTIFHVDDDLLAIPKEISREKFAFHNLPERIASIRHLLDHASLVYCSTKPLCEQFQSYGGKAPVMAGEVYCSAVPLVAPEVRLVRKIGYMGIGHEEDFMMVLPAVVAYLRRNPTVSFEVFGTIKLPPVLEEFGTRISCVPKIENYDEFLHRFAEYQWDIGICPLASIPFNLLKANTKWVEYTAVGAAVIASRGTVYDSCCEDGCGILADSEGEWLAALELLTNQPKVRAEMVSRAQSRLEREYTPEHLRQQVMQMIGRSRDNSHKCKISLQPLQLRKKEFPERILFVVNAYVPTLQLSFVKPLASLVSSGQITFDILSEEQIKNKLWRNEGYSTAKEWVINRFESFRPDLVVFCRYSGPYASDLLVLVESVNVPTIYHIDDDLLGIPKEIGESKHSFHNQKARLDTVRLLLERCSLVYASTQKLKKHLLSLKIPTHIVEGNIYCSGQPINLPVYRPVRKIGYMASADHAHNLTNVLGAIVRLLRKHPKVNFEFFGSIQVPKELAEFGNRIRRAQPIKDYEQFLQKFAEYQWDIGICPLSRIHFNLMKANTKWVEYTSVGAAVVASRDTVYDECCSDGCGLLAETEDEWFEALDYLVSDPKARFQQVIRAQKKLKNFYSTDRLRDQVLDVFIKSHQLAANSS